MNKIDINSNSTYIKNYINNFLNEKLNNRNFSEISEKELVELNSSLTYFNEILNDKLILQEIQLDSLEKSLRKKLNLLKK